ncbi:MAG: hypothetical protein ABIR11_11110, partial [Candidatus Limnocylindrales bacterium]
MTATRDPRTDAGAGVGERLHRLCGTAAAGRLAAATVPTTDIDPISLYAAAVEADLEAALWLRPSEGTAFVGIGRAWATEPEGPGRFREAEAAWRALITGASLDRPADVARGAGPVLLGAMGFTGRRPAADDAWAPFGASSLVLPALILAQSPAGTTVTASIILPADASPDANAEASPADATRDARALERRWSSLVERARDLAPSPSGMVARPVFAPLTVAEEQPTREEFQRLVGQFSGAVGRGRIDKVVLARRVGMRSPVELDVANALRRLAVSAPESTTYAFRRDGRTFL